MHEELKPCPFCNSTDLKIDHKSVKSYDPTQTLFYSVERHTYSVRCNKCYARGSTASGRVILYFYGSLPEWATTDKALAARAVSKWNRRPNYSDEEYEEMEKIHE